MKDRRQKNRGQGSSATLTPSPGISRRAFLKVSMAASGALVVGVGWSGLALAEGMQ